MIFILSLVCSECSTLFQPNHVKLAGQLPNSSPRTDTYRYLPREGVLGLKTTIADKHTSSLNQRKSKATEKPAHKEVWPLTGANYVMMQTEQQTSGNGVEEIMENLQENQTAALLSRDLTGLSQKGGVRGWMFFSIVTILWTPLMKDI